ncbi:MAG TPA: hypothetical protein VLF41_01945 [Candidatus Nanoarchaeia archaeon]|nr:hypothetical protein [Candidatus Nanoarchaeia archaeon]
MFGLAFSALAVLIIVVLAILVFEIAMFVSVIQNEKITTEVKLLWILGMFLIHPFIAIAYYFSDHRKN